MPKTHPHQSLALWRWFAVLAGVFSMAATSFASTPIAAALESDPELAGSTLVVAASADTCLITTPPNDFDLSTDRRTMVYRLYCSVFLRLPDQRGFDYWVSLASRQNMAGSEIAAQFITSGEFQQRYGSLDDHAFLDLVYRNVLGRRPDARGYAYWDGVLAQPRFGRNDLMLYFSDSDEFRAATQTLAPRPKSSTPPATGSAWLPEGMTARQASDAELSTGTFDPSLCSGYGGRVDWFTPPYDMQWCVNMPSHFDQITIDGVYTHEAIHARIGALFARRGGLTPTERAEVTRVALYDAPANEGLADFWAMRLVPGYEGSPDYADAVFNNEVWDTIFAKYPIGGALPTTG